jgi:pimeloyl-ACP methyl ester carboxylesterase
LQIKLSPIILLRKVKKYREMNDTLVENVGVGIKKSIANVYLDILYLAYDVNINYIINLIKKIIIIWIVAEILFYFLMNKIVGPGVQRFKKRQPYLDDADPVEFVHQILDTIDLLETYDISKFCKGFFCGASIENIYEDNLKSFLAWAMYQVRTEDLTFEENEKMMKAYDEALRRYDLKLKPGYNNEVNHVCMTYEPIPFYHRPLIIYIITGVIELICNSVLLRYRGFYKYEFQGMKYWYRHGLNPTSQAPIVICHGITNGWMFFANFLEALGRQRTIILVEVDSIKVQSMVFEMPSPQQFTDIVENILRRHNYDKCSLIGHSFGSITSGWIVKVKPELVSHLTLLDPVSLLLCLPDVAFNFIYRKPTSLMEWLILIVASRELTISHTLHRNFWWYNNVLYLDQIPNNIGVIVGIAGGDEVLNAESVYEYTEICSQYREQDKSLQQDGKEVASIIRLFWEGMSHGQLFMDKPAVESIIKSLQINEKQKKI